MTAAPRPAGGAVPWLTAQSLAFGMMAALLGIVANAMFLDAYGAEWLPATYIAIGAAGVVVSGAVAKTAQRFDLVGIAVAVLGAAAAGILLAWVIAAGGDASWVSVPLLVLFPILIQLGFVFLIAQAGRLLDISELKSGFPRIMTGFPMGAVAGGLLGAQLVTLLGEPQGLLLATAIAQAAFAALLWVTGRRFAARLTVAPSSSAVAAPEAEASRGVRAALRRWTASRFVALILGYQVLSALGSQLSDYLVYDRAGAQFPDPADLARYLAGYTAVMNVASIVFLFVVAGPLLRRFGLRLGIAANPVVLLVFAVAMLAVVGVAGAASTALLLTVSAARIADIALTDGTTRTSVTIAYQAVPERSQLAVQAAIEGMAVPVAIGVSGVVILALNVLPDPLVATIMVTVLVCAAWSWLAIRLYGAYGPALVHALRRRPLLVATDRIEAGEGDEAAARRLIASPDGLASRLGAELLTAMASPALAAELRDLADDPRPDVRMAALAGLAAEGDRAALARLGAEAREAAGSPDPAMRLRAARAMGALDVGDRSAARELLGDQDVVVRAAALDSVQAGDAFAVEAVVAAFREPRVAGPAAGAAGRLGDAMVPLLAARLEAANGPDASADPVIGRLVRSMSTSTPARDAVLRRHVGHPDREVGRLVMERLVAAGPADEGTAAALDDALADDVRYAARILAAMAAFRPAMRDADDRALPAPDADPGARAAGDGPLHRALADELELVRQRVVAGRLARHGSVALGPALVAVRGDGTGTAMAVEALGVLLGSDARQVLAILDPALSSEDRRGRLPPALDAPTGIDGWLRELIEDPGHTWRSPWLRACAIHAGRGHGVLAGMDLGAAHALGDPIVDQELAEAPEISRG